MLEIHQSILEDQIPQIKFACDLSACKGSCCTIPGGTGAPLLDEELHYLHESYPLVQSLLPEDHRRSIEQFGLYEGTPGSFTTMCFNNRACVFVVYEDGIARCAFEKAFMNGKINWRKPISCHLFPIRVSSDAIKQLRYEHITECEPAVLRGHQEHIYLSEFLHDPLVRAFGTSWYNDFHATCIQSREQRNLLESNP
jgi:hypothetical protein